MGGQSSPPWTLEKISRYIVVGAVYSPLNATVGSNSGGATRRDQAGRDRRSGQGEDWGDKCPQVVWLESKEESLGRRSEIPRADPTENQAGSHEPARVGEHHTYHLRFRGSERHAHADFAAALPTARSSCAFSAPAGEVACPFGPAEPIATPQMGHPSIKADANAVRAWDRSAGAR